MVTLRNRIEAVWDGSDLWEGLSVTSAAGGPCHAAVSIFGCGILTFHIGYLFRTPEKFNLHVRGPANWPKDGISPLEGIVETDWADATFTMNWKMTRPNHRVIFEAGEPIAMISPVRRGELEAFRAQILPIAADQETSAQYDTWSASRSSFNEELQVSDSAAQKAGGQKHYAQGRTVAGSFAQAHQTSVPLAEFKE